MNRDFARLLLAHFGLRAETDEAHENLVEYVANTVERRCGKPIFPNHGESLAMSVMTPKTAALAFDRVYRIPIVNEPVPEEIGFYGATATEIAWWSGSMLIMEAGKLGIDYFGSQKSGASSSTAERVSHTTERESLRLITSEFQSVFGKAPTIFYHSSKGFNGDFPTGTQQVLTAAIQNIALVEEKSLSWEQVLEFRKDRDARAKYRRLIRWIDAELRTSTPAEVEDSIAVRLDDYEWALRKHGLKATLGGLTSMLDPKFLGATSATTAASALAGGEVWAALAAGCLLIGQAAVSAGTALVNSLEERRKENYEVAYIHDVHRSFGKGA